MNFSEYAIFNHFFIDKKALNGPIRKQLVEDTFKRSVLFKSNPIITNYEKITKML